VKVEIERKRIWAGDAGGRSGGRERCEQVLEAGKVIEERRVCTDDTGGGEWWKKDV